MHAIYPCFLHLLLDKTLHSELTATLSALAVPFNEVYNNAPADVQSTLQKVGGT